MGLFIKSTTNLVRHGAFAVEVQPPLIITGAGTGTASCVGQFPWGPVATLIEPESVPDMINTIAPAGMDHTGSAYMAVTGKYFPALQIVRILGAGSMASYVTLTDQTTPAHTLTLTLKCPGTAGNAVSYSITAATDGVTGHFNLTVWVTGVSGTTTDSLQNLNYSGTGADSVPDLSGCYLLGSITKSAPGDTFVPTNSSTFFSHGSDGAAITSATYAGTPGTGNSGLALLEGAQTNVVFVDDPGSTIVDAVNEALIAHQILTGDREVFMCGPTGQTPTAVLANVVTLGASTSEGAMYFDGWCNVADDATGALHLVPFAPYAASARVQYPPSTSIAWKAPEMQAVFQTIVSLEFNRGTNAIAANTLHGVATVIAEQNGGFSIEADVLTVNPVNPAIGKETRIAVGLYIAKSLTQSTRPMIDAANVSVNQDAIYTATYNFLDGLKSAASGQDPQHNTYIVDFGIQPIDQANTTAQLQGNQLRLPFQVTTGASIAQLLFQMQFGQTVVVTFTNGK